jgi:hypothetical protein
MINKLRFYIKVNLLWLFKYRCRIPAGVYFFEDAVLKGSVLYIANKRLHIAKAALESKPTGKPIGIALADNWVAINGSVSWKEE